MIILITGTESSGKSMLTKQLADHYGVKYVPEYARTYLTDKGSEYEEKDLLHIAQEHFNILIKERNGENEPLFLDSFLLNIKIWSEFKYGKCDPWIRKKLDSLEISKTLLLYPNTPWVEDPLRENPHSRKQLFSIFEKELTELNWDFSIIDELEGNRLEQAIEIVNSHILSYDKK